MKNSDVTVTDQQPADLALTTEDTTEGPAGEHLLGLRQT